MISPVVLHIKVPRENTKGPVAMEGVYDGLDELFRHEQTPVAFEIVLKNGFLYFIVVCERRVVDLVRGQLYSQYQNLELEEISDYSGTFFAWPSITTLTLKRPHAYPLRTYRNLPNDFLTNLSGMATSVGKNESAAIQIILRAIDADSLSFKSERFLETSWRSALRKNSSLRELLEEEERKKLQKSLFRATIRIATATGSKSDALGASIASLFKILDNEHLNELKIWNVSHRTQTAEEYKSRVMTKNLLLSSEELATIYHFPYSGANISQVAVSKTKMAEPPTNLPVSPEAIPFAVTNFRGSATQFGIKREDRRKHLYIIGKTGVGKSKLIELLALADIREGKGCVIMDPHGDLAEELLRYIPRERLYDIIYFNPADREYPMGFNPLESVGSFEYRQNVVAGFIAIFKKLFGFTWNQRLEHVLRFTTLALLDVPGTTVLGITKMLSETDYRQEIVAQIQDPLIKKFWTTEFSSWNEQYAGEAITPVINKVGQFVANPLIRNIVGQGKSTVKIDELINNEKIVIANFAIGKLGEENSALLGAMFITKLWQAAVARASLPEGERKDTFLYVDEFQNFATSAFANILSEARKYKLNLTVAHQYMMQLPEEVRSTVFGNVGSIIAFRVGGEDASVLEKEYSPTFSSQDFMNLDMRNFYIKMTIDGQTALPFSGKTLDFPKPDADLLTDVVRISRERWAHPRSDVERELMSDTETPSPAPEAKAQTFSEPII
ncbi:type IV secretion system DNA-binding domain-containing protein [Patescibacteria group bacterium]|nr:type IV secretion system DNA-binding domain-containing protein [Patescibacteria group bacterium]